MIYLFILCLCGHLVSANPLAKLLLQTRPNCNQNGFNTYNVPIQTNNQPYAPPVMIQNPMTTRSNNQPFGPQNGLPIQIKVDDSQKSYLNKILANPMVQKILNPNNNNFNQNNNDFALQASTGQTPNIVNNYYIIPSECLQGNDGGVGIVKKLIGDQAIICDECPKQRNAENERKSMQRSQNRQSEENRRPKGARKHNNQENGVVKNQNNNKPQKRRRKNGNKNPNNENKRANGHNHNMNNKNREIVKIKDERPRKRNHTQESEPRKNGNKKRKRPKNKSQNETIDDISSTSNDTVTSKIDIVLNENKNEYYQKDKRKQTEIIGSAKDEHVIRNIHKKFPGIPKDVIRRLLRYLRRQLQSQFSDTCIESNQLQNINNDTKKRRNNRNKRRKIKNNTDLAEVTETPLSFTTDNSYITSTVIETKEPQQYQVETSSKHNEQEHTTQVEIETDILETTTNNVLQTLKLGEEDKILNVENDIDDYFPDFRFDKMYMSEDDYIRSLRDNRFYYTTDRNLGKDNKNDESSEIYYEPYESQRQKVNKLQSDEIEDTLARPDKDDYDETVLKDYSAEELEFKTPPMLEFPDFETKPIIKYFDVDGPIYKPESKNIDNTSDKSSTYSDAKSVNTPIKNKPKSDIETVFAGSKVVKYGQPEEIGEAALSKNENPKFDDTVLVYASSS